MKTSMYNFFYESKINGNKEKMLAYNSRTNGLAVIDQSNYTKYVNFEKHNIEIDDPTLINNLKKGGFVLNSDIDELEMIRFQLLTKRYNRSSLSLTIAPTLDCNFACSYCFEKNSRQKTSMSQQVQKQIIEFVEKQIPTISSLNITWYGGEPLLEIDIIENLSKKLILICENNNVEYRANIVSNGYNLTTEVSKILLDSKVYNIQITLDGPSKIHDMRRPLINGGGTYSRIIENIKINKDYFKGISIRINVDEKNKEEVNKILDDLDKNDLKDKVQINLGYVESTNDCYCTNLCANYKEFCDFDYDFKINLENKGYDLSFMLQYPRLRYNICGADSINSFVVDPKGNLYKCWSDIGILDKVIGNLSGQNDNENGLAVLYKYMFYDPTQDAECSVCKYLPICMGGCPRRRIDGITDRCSEYKYKLESYIQRMASRRMASSF